MLCNKPIWVFIVQCPRWNKLKCSSRGCHRISTVQWLWSAFEMCYNKLFQHPWLVVNLICSIPLMFQVDFFSLQNLIPIFLYWPPPVLQFAKQSHNPKTLDNLITFINPIFDSHPFILTPTPVLQCAQQLCVSNREEYNCWRKELGWPRVPSSLQGYTIYNRGATVVHVYFYLVSNL